MCDNLWQHPTKEDSMAPTLTDATGLTDLAGTGKLGQNAEKLPNGKTASSFDPARYVGEPKLDGWRLLVHRHADGVALYTRSGKRHDGSLPTIEAELEANLPVGTWLDCEAVGVTVIDGKVSIEWGIVQSILGSTTGKAAAQEDKITLMAFDLIAHGDIDARGLSFGQRRELLEAIFDGAEWKRTILVPQVQPTDNSVEALLAQGFEGMVIKDRKARYASGQRGKGWTKIKATYTDDVVIMGFKPGENGFSGMVGAVIFGEYDDEGNLVETGRASGMDMRTRENMTKNPDKWIGTVIEISHMGRLGGPDSPRRHPQTKRPRPDKAPTDCTISANNG
jgi:bifunctional non-homologous end joining protein LigD